LLAYNIITGYTKTGGEMSEKREPYVRQGVQMAFRLSEEERLALKIFALKKGKTVQALIFEALDKTFPDWRKTKE
jgi:hypothetical protein